LKANGAKRKIFNDAIDLLDQMEEATVVPKNAVRMLPAESIPEMTRRRSQIKGMPQTAIQSQQRKAMRLQEALITTGGKEL
jgi:hypothetical protein